MSAPNPADGKKNDEQHHPEKAASAPSGRRLNPPHHPVIEVQVPDKQEGGEKKKSKPQNISSQSFSKFSMETGGDQQSYLTPSGFRKIIVKKSQLSDKSHLRRENIDRPTQMTFQSKINSTFI